MKLSSEPEVVVVTGASADLWRAIVREFAREGRCWFPGGPVQRVGHSHARF
jgi:NAD(P)-dependent dehydrogenase (short-subunit alcohol dehydrogenase family)